ncbi:MAG TPA: isochorismatase family cysteine hydrolase [Syntrophomonas sp.]|nr:isochorismatase family cysteine hydrolase [Syntrophomonas sp.]
MKRDRKFLSFYYDTTEEFPEIKLNPKKTALLIVDMQNEFILRDFGESLAFQERGEWDRWIPFHDRLDNIVIPNNKKLLDFFRENNLVVTFGRIACLREDGEDRSPVQKSEGWNNMLLHADSFAAQMIEPLTPRKGEIVVNKTTDSVTTGTNYLQLLRYMGIDTVVVTGIVTDQCVASTVRGLADDGFKVICVEDACAAGDMELHNSELKIMNIIYCDVFSADETIEMIKNRLETDHDKIA